MTILTGTPVKGREQYLAKIAARSVSICALTVESIPFTRLKTLQILPFQLKLNCPTLQPLLVLHPFKTLSHSL